MIDYKHNTFLEVCRLGSFTKAADALCITQPAVSQHISSLEELYQGKLIIFQKRRFSLTEKGTELYNFLTSMQVDCKRTTDSIINNSDKKVQISFGATLTIGEYVMPSILTNLMKENPDLQIRMLVDNTQSLLSKLDSGTIQFAFIEGAFNRNRYESKVFSNEDFIAVSSPDLLNNNILYFNDLYNNRLIVREKGSGTRMVLEQILQEYNSSIENFSSYTEIGNMSAIKDLVKEGLGITFLYKSAVQLELEEKSLIQLPLKNFKHLREFSFVYLKDSVFSDEYFSWYKTFQRLR